MYGSNNQTADFIGVSILPLVGEAPFERNPEADLGDYFSSMYLLSSRIDVPLVLAQVDWPENNARNKKARFLSVLKHEMSPFEVMFLAWRRYSDLDEEHCPRFTNAMDPSMAYPRDYCDSGLVDKYGRPQASGASASDSVFSQLVAE